MWFPDLRCIVRLCIFFFFRLETENEAAEVAGILYKGMLYGCVSSFETALCKSSWTDVLTSEIDQSFFDSVAEPKNKPAGMWFHKVPKLTNSPWDST